MIEIFEIFWSSPIELRVIILGGLISPFILLRNNDKKGIEWVAVDHWYCNDCQTDIDDTIEEMEMHECKK